jgi:hypothetical protein
LQARQAELSRRKPNATGTSGEEPENAEHNREEAEKNLARAEKAVELFLSRATDDPQLKDVSFSNFKISLLQEAVAFYDEIVAVMIPRCAPIAHGRWQNRFALFFGSRTVRTPWSSAKR